MGIEMTENAGEQDKEGMSSHVIRHVCKVCNRSFGCAGALGGHMRAHVIMGDHHLINEKPESSSNNNNNKHSYFLRAKTASRNFMGYHNLSDHFEEGDNFLRKPSSSSSSQHNFDHYEYNNSANSSEDEDLANCLVMLSNNDKSCNDNINSSSNTNNNNEENHHKAKEVVVEKGNMFQCKACKKVFNSHQALGGHRASHKKVKGCFAAKTDIIGNLNDELDELESIQEEDHHHHEQPVMHTPSSSTTSNPRKPRAKMHECSVCRRVFSSGQALGGHKRCHWLTTSTDNAFIPNFHDHFQYHHQQQTEQLYKKSILTNPHHERNLDNHNDYNNINHDLDLNLNLPTHAGDFHSHDTSRYHEDESTRLYLQKLTNHKKQKIEKDGQKGSCEIKLRKLSDLTDVNLDGSWLQVGMTSTTDIY